MTKTAHEIFDGCTGSGGQGLTSVAEIVESEARHSRLASSTVERLAYRVTAHGVAITADEYAIFTGPGIHVSYENGKDMRWDGHSALASVGLGVSVECFGLGKEFDPGTPDGDRAYGEVYVGWV